MKPRKFFFSALFGLGLLSGCSISDNHVAPPTNPAAIRIENSWKGVQF